MKTATPLFTFGVVLALAASSAYAQLGESVPPPSGATAGNAQCTRRPFLVENLQTTSRGTLYRTQDAYDSNSIGACCEVCYVDRDCLAFTFNLSPGYSFGCFLRDEAVRGSIDDIDGCPSCISGFFTQNLTGNADSLSGVPDIGTLNASFLATTWPNSTRGSGRRMLRAEDFQVHLKF